ncbi:TetR/AcrR family transcriptional regulator [Lentzea sp. NEAU-D13]|uniref:TetR/AcrR family transcriptional regulator n=1 Tax=Lentzea alba TaxID=2714351 RepID=A0A7C9RT46_9PSEU|nr:TetR/AcrR family transcriptional regulator [Lentzea alba]NGY61283.1 TetR/AcrR family transcriptional regulator [Lentzea alba]
MPKLWSDTVDEHRREVRDAVLDATAQLVHEQGLRAVTMSEIAAKAGIGRATLYKYFADVETILFAWHERQIVAHLAELARVRDQAEEPLLAVLEAYAHITGGSRQHHHGGELASILHRDHRLAHAHRQLHQMVCELITVEVRAGRVRRDVAPEELAQYCLHALGAAGELSSKAAVSRLVSVTMAGLRGVS